MRKVTERIIQLGDRKELVTQEDLPYIISDVLKHDSEKNKVRLLSYFVTLAQGLKPMATLSIEINGQTYQESFLRGWSVRCFCTCLAENIQGNSGPEVPHVDKLCGNDSPWRADRCFCAYGDYLEF